ncbi:Integrase [Vibrio crassostreae]|nr:Integrase [Vibrio crassostreae]CAK2275881.1 Integrase [Vibrio crassostreae]CAK2413142.1 Integrase [Vibrio crassostreae]CAK2644983.1 Integrase [Vibrio crassostreae]
MAKKKANKKITKIAKSLNKVISLPVVDRYNLSPYKHYVDSPTNSYRLFFEHPKSKDEVNSDKHSQKSFFYAGQYTRGGAQGKFWIVGSGKELVGEDIAKKFAQLLTKKILVSDLAKGSIAKFQSVIKCFFIYLSSQPSPPASFSELNINHFSRWCDTFPSKKAANYLSHMKMLFEGIPFINLKSIRIRKDEIVKPTPLRDINFDELVRPADYSDVELIQILSYVFYEIERSREQFELLKNVSSDMLGKDYLPLNEITSRNPTLTHLFNSKEDGHRALMANLTLLLRQKDNEIPLGGYSHASLFQKKLNSVSKTKTWKHLDPYKKYMSFLLSQCWPTSYKSKGNEPDYKWLTLQSHHHEFAILLYLMITTGVNLEAAMSLKWFVNGKPWYKNFDVQMGITEISAPQNQSIVLVGKKIRGQTKKQAVKPINIPLDVTSPLYSYLKFLDKTRPPKRIYLFTIGKSTIHILCKSFCSHYQIFNENGERIPSLHTTRFRKTFVGHELLKLLKDVKNTDELVSRLKTALHHEQFDTTFFSYIMKSGLSNLTMDSAIVALTTDMLEKMMTFQGQIKLDNEREAGATQVFLCDCSDPSKPTHNLPVAGQCKTYDLCLGCTRSEVYAEHLPAICYRIFQYEQQRKSDPDIFKATLDDRLHTALDTVNQFKIRHPKGQELVEHAYATANLALKDHTPLLPPILQSGISSCKSLK